MSTYDECSYENAAVAADSPESSQIGTSIMKDQGGSAVDAAIAAILCSGVVNAHSCGIGGGAFITYYQRSTGKVYTINGREQAPSGINAEMFTDDILSNRVGGLSIFTPGEILALHELWKLGGRLPWKKLFLPTIDLCKNGFLIRKAMSTSIDALIRNDSLHLKEKVPSFIVFLTNPETGSVYKEGDKMYRPRLAKTLEKIADEGPESFYSGSLSDDIVSDVKEAGGILTKNDLANFKAPNKPPLALKLNEELTVYSPPLPSSGIVYQFILNILKGFNFDETSVSTRENAITTWHRITEAFKHATALKNRVGDNDIGTQEFKTNMDEILKRVTDDEFVESKRQKIKDSETFDSTYYEHDSNGHMPECHGTSHVSVIGPEGDAVSVTSTVSLYFGSKVVGSRTGIIFNDEVRNFTLPYRKNRHGRPPSEGNSLEPLKRPLSSMCPSIVVDKDGDVKLVIGASGSTRIPTAIALITMETIWFNWGIKKAIDYPRIHHQLYPPKLTVQEGFPQELIDGLKGIGHEVTNINSFSVVQGILRTGNKITAYSDPRKEGPVKFAKLYYAVTYEWDHVCFGTVVERLPFQSQQKHRPADNVSTNFGVTAFLKAQGTPQCKNNEDAQCEMTTILPESLCAGVECRVTRDATAHATAQWWQTALLQKTEYLPYSVCARGGILACHVSEKVIHI